MLKVGGFPPSALIRYSRSRCAVKRVKSETQQVPERYLHGATPPPVLHAINVSFSVTESIDRQLHALASYRDRELLTVSLVPGRGFISRCYLT